VSSSLLQSDAFVVLNTDFQNGGDPPIWKIDGKTLLQKYVPFEKDVNSCYKNTSMVRIYCSWDKTYLYQGHRLCDWMMLETSPLWQFYSCLRLTGPKSISPQASVCVLRYISTGTTSLLDFMEHCLKLWRTVEFCYSHVQQEVILVRRCWLC